MKHMIRVVSYIQTVIVVACVIALMLSVMLIDITMATKAVVVFFGLVVIAYMLAVVKSLLQDQLRRKETAEERNNE